MSEVIVKLTDNHIKVKNGEYVQDLVRCEDCKWQYECDNTVQITHRDGNNMSLKFVPIDFCSYGER